jgi:hypothetical protein
MLYLWGASIGACLVEGWHIPVKFSPKGAAVLSASTLD